MPQAAFNRYDGVADADASIKMPEDIFDARATRLSIGELMLRYENFTKDPIAGAATYPWAERFVMGFPLPSWQRPVVWTMTQKLRFILSIWQGVDLGSYLVNDIWEYVADDKGVLREFSDVLLDGQQRLTAMEDYINNVFPVPDADGVPRYWRDLPQIVRRRFCNITFTKATVASWDEGMLRKVYDLRSFGGTAHTEDQRAS
ncbi:DUF262 domain-containing protein [Pseudomonas viridiflava]|uniref:DUF262 domain-containing protein n=1 Tax=Pseudomonas viridiflava TaxID=33069 RepID=UPI0018E5E811|nr:DUF262 domain-containing protein [Pseudomonas viridiflava]MBI6727144.1 DUF262 domain-containing protein [Pseudomonas viridiflava]